MDIEWSDAAKPAAPARKHVTPGIHTVVVSSAEETRSKKGHEMLKLILRVQGGMDNGLHIYEYLNVGHPTVTVREIALSKLRELAAAVGIARKFNTGELTGKTCQATVYLDQGGDYGPTARVRSFAAIETNNDMEAADLPF
jgi:hypothetical protein